jgi:hypothetical protein
VTGVEDAGSDDGARPVLPAPPRGAREHTDAGTGPGDSDSDTDSVRLRAAAVERLPLPERADAFAALHDELRTRLEQGGDSRG